MLLVTVGIIVNVVAVLLVMFTAPAAPRRRVTAARRRPYQRNGTGRRRSALDDLSRSMVVDARLTPCAPAPTSSRWPSRSSANGEPHSFTQAVNNAKAVSVPGSPYANNLMTNYARDAGADVSYHPSDRVGGARRP